MQWAMGSVGREAGDKKGNPTSQCCIPRAMRKSPPVLLILFRSINGMGGQTHKTQRGTGWKTYTLLIHGEIKAWVWAFRILSIGHVCNDADSIQTLVVKGL